MISKQSKKEIAKKYGLNVDTIRIYMKRHDIKITTLEEYEQFCIDYVAHINQRPETVYKKYGITSVEIRRFKELYGHKYTTVDELCIAYIDYRDKNILDRDIKLRKKADYFSNKCREAKIPEEIIPKLRHYRIRHKLSEDEVIRAYLCNNNLIRRINLIPLNDRNKYIKKCKELGMTYEALKLYANSHNISIDEAINIYEINGGKLHNKRTTKEIKELCELLTKLNIDSKKYFRYESNTGCKDIYKNIIHFRPDCYINLFGELVIPE